VRASLNDSFWPDSFSTDWNVTSKTTGVVDLPNCMSKLLGYGMTVPQAVARYLNEHALPKQAVCWPVLQALDWTSVGVTVEARPARGDDLVGMTGAFCAIAETGTLMMLSGAETPGATSLLPETHIAVVPENRIVRAMEDAWALLRAERGDTAMPRAVNFISGPSRTADIEQTLVMGAHGPYRVHVILTGD